MKRYLSKIIFDLNSFLKCIFIIKGEEKLKNKLMLLKENDAVPKVVQEISSPTDLMKCKGNDDVTKESHFSNSCAGNINNSNRSACDINDVTINKSMTDLSISEKEPKQFYFYQVIHMI